MHNKKSDNVIKFGKAKKSLARQGKDKNAAVNRARFGQKKSVKELKLEMTKKLQKKLDAHKIERAETDTSNINGPDVNRPADKSD